MRWILALILPFLLAGCSSTPSAYTSRSGCASVVVVRSGDTLGEVAQRCHVSLRTLARFNGIDPPYVIRIGQRLRIPDARAVAAQQYIAPQHSLPKRTAQRLLIWPLAEATVQWKPDPKGGAAMLLRSRKPMPVRAMTAGKVVTLTRLPTYGPVIVIDHGKELYGVYARLQQIEVKSGQSVAAGQVLGRCAPEGRDASVCYVELREGRHLLDLRRWQNWSGR